MIMRDTGKLSDQLKDNSMLDFTKKQMRFTVTKEMLVSTKLIDQKIRTIFVELDGTLVDLETKINRLLELNDTMFKEFSELLKSD